ATLVTSRMSTNKKGTPDRMLEVKDTVSTTETISERDVSAKAIPTGKNIKLTTTETQSVSQSKTQTKTQLESKTTASATLSMALESSGDAPPCDVCGTITVRSGTCYKCLNCGNSLGCS
ncbi:MAG: hypothetical protein ACWA5W_00420, partial [Phycisphaerales bacterium]